jgi:hypothetical protein
MSTMLPPPARSFRRRWADFWFAPGDPTTLGFIRVVTGLLILYTHLAYSLDLQAFFGRYGWYGSAYIERERHEFPWTVNPVWDWTDPAQPRVPEFPHRREAVLKFIRGLPEKKEDRARALRFLDMATREDNARTVAAMGSVLRLYEAGPERDKLLAGLEQGKQYYRYPEGGVLVYKTEAPGREYVAVFPDYLLGLQPADRAAVAADLRALLAALPTDPTEADYTIKHLAELDQAHRRALVAYLAALPDDKAERDRLIDYLDYWNHDPRTLHRQGHALVSVWFHVKGADQMAAVHALSIVIMLLFTLGFCTRVTGVLTWVAVVGYIHRTNQILFGMDTMMNILLVYLVIGNSGAALSVDRLIARYRAARASIRRSGTIDDATRAFLAQAPPSAGANLGVRLIQVHFCFIYLAAGLAKLKGAAWWNGFAFWDVMVNPEFTLLRYHWFEDMVRATASIKPLYYTVTATGVWFTWGLEVVFPFLVWTRLRVVMLWLAVLLHASIGVLMGLNLFELLMMTMLLVFFPPGVIRDRLRGAAGLARLGFGFDAAEATQARAAALVAAADIDGQVTVEPAKGKSLPAVTAAGKTTTGPAGAAALFTTLRLLRVFRFLLVVPGVSGLLTRLFVPTPAAPPSTTGSNGPKTPAAAS